MMDERHFLEELIRRESFSGSEQRVATYLLHQMGRRGFRVGRDAVGNVWGEVGPADGEQSAFLLGHMDTVAGVIPVHWEGDALYGRGTVDAKGSLAAFVLAAAEVAPRLSRTRVRVVGVVEEERESRGAHHLAERPGRPDFCVIGEPSGWDGITLGYKGVLRVEYHRARPATHSADVLPSVAEDAVTFWNRLSALATTWSQGKSPFRSLGATLRSVHTDGDGLLEWVYLAASLRLPPGLDPEELKQRLQSWADGAEVLFPYQEPPVEVPKNSPLVRSFLRAIRTVGGQPRFKLKTGTSDMNVLGPAWGCPIVAYGPGDSSLDHTPHEHLSFEEFRRSVDVLAAALENLDAARE
ncbi:MAG: [LysW]-lysine hydrolase [Anaerolineae bacterium]